MQQVTFKSAILFICLSTAITSNAQAQYWNTTGNVVTSGQFLGSTNNMPLEIKTNNATRMRVETSGNVGIGTGAAVASQRLQIKGGNLLLDYASGTSTGNIFLGGVTASNNNGMRLSYTDGTYKSGYIDVRTNDTDPSKGLIFRVDNGIAGTERMRIRRDGRVTIGAVQLDPNNPGAYGLYVRNGILTEKIKVSVYVANNWADYVFAPDYKLMPLEEVEAFVKTNKHLPNVPSAQALVNEGLDLGQMQAKQMEKIEELTLYLIDMKKEIEALKAENAALKTAVGNR